MGLHSALANTDRAAALQVTMPVAARVSTSTSREVRGAAAAFDVRMAAQFFAVTSLVSLGHASTFVSYGNYSPTTRQLLANYRMLALVCAYSTSLDDCHQTLLLANYAYMLPLRETASMNVWMN